MGNLSTIVVFLFSIPNVILCEYSHNNNIDFIQVRDIVRYFTRVEKKYKHYDFVRQSFSRKSN